MTSKMQWPALESNPEVMTKFLRSLGVPAPTSVVDIYGFDEELAAFLPKPVYAVLFCFPDYKKFDELYRPIYEKLVADGVKVPDWMFFARQNISNACGTFALIHATLNSRDRIDIGNGILSSFADKANDVPPDAKSDVLAAMSDFAKAHEACAVSGETEQNEKTEHHFIAFIVHDNKLWEIDSRAPVPRERGATSEDTLVTDVGKIAKEYIDATGGSISFSAMALVGQESL